MPITLQHIGQHSGIRLGGGLGGVPDLHQQIAHRGRIARHFGFQFEIGKAGIAQQRRAFLPQGQRFGSNRTVVGGPAIGPARAPGKVCFLPQIAPVGKLQEWHDQGPRQGHDRTVRAFFGPCGTRCRQHEIGQPAQIIRPQRHHPVAFVSQQVLHELRAQHRQPRFDRTQAGGGVSIQQGTRPHKAAPRQHQHALLFGGQIERVAGGPQYLDPREQRLVFRNLGGIGAEQGREIALQGVARRRAVGPCKAVERAQHAVQRGIGLFQRRDRIGEIGRIGIIRNRRDIGARQGQRRIHRGREIIIRDGAKRRQAKGRVPVGQQRVGHSETPVDSVRPLPAQTGQSGCGLIAMVRVWA